jgi:hypothetical protein
MNMDEQAYKLKHTRDTIYPVVGSPQRLAYVHVVEEATNAKDHKDPLVSLTYHFGQ